MKKRKILTLLGAMLWATSFVSAEELNPVFKSLKYGIFVHHAWGGTAYSLTKHPDLSVPKSIDEVANSFDIPRFVRDLQDAGCEYISFTSWHAAMNPIFPSAAMDKWRGPGHAAKRDIVGELIKELKPTGIKLFLYIHFSDGHDMTKEDQEKLGWNESINEKDNPKSWKPGRYVKWNNFCKDVFEEMSIKYGKDVYGYWVDGGWERADQEGLKQIVWKYNPKAEFVSGMDNAGWCNQFNRMIPPDPKNGIPAAIPSNADTWPSFRSNVNILQGGCWWSTGGVAKISPVDMLRYTVLQAATNTDGGGVGWAADPYTDGTWEPNVREYFAMLGQLIKPIEESIKSTHPSDAWITPQGARIATLPLGMVATQSLDGNYEYIHVLRGATGTSEKDSQRYVSALQLPPTANFKKFTKAVMLRSGREATLTQNEKGVLINVPWQDAWDPIDTVIKLTGVPGYGILSRNKTVTMSGTETPGWSLKHAVDGDMGKCWSSEATKPGEAPWIMIDLESVVELSRVHIYPRVMDKIVGHNFPVDFEISVSNDGQTFSKGLTVTDYKMSLPRSVKTEFIWDPGLNDYRKAAEGEDTGDLSLSGSGKKSAGDYPQYFAMPAGIKGRYVKIIGTKLMQENRMQFSEIEVLGAK